MTVVGRTGQLNGLERMFYMKVCYRSEQLIVKMRLIYMKGRTGQLRNSVRIFNMAVGGRIKQLRGMDRII